MYDSTVAVFCLFIIIVDIGPRHNEKPVLVVACWFEPIDILKLFANGATVKFLNNLHL